MIIFERDIYVAFLEEYLNKNKTSGTLSAEDIELIKKTKNKNKSVVDNLVAVEGRMRSGSR